MPRLEQMPPEDMPEVVRRASLLFQQEQDDAQERRSTRDAAAEVGLPPEYLERAAQEVYAARVAQIQTRRRRRSGALATVGLALALAGGWAVTHRPPPPAAYHLASPAEGWHLEQDSGSQATLTTTPEGARIQVRQFGASEPFVNLDSKNVPPTLTGYRTITFRVRGSGLPQIRLYLENGNERWRSPALPVSASWQMQTLPLTQFDRQTRRSASDGWRREGYRAPGAVERLSFKLGTFVNAPSARGTVEISGLEFK